MKIEYKNKNTKKSRKQIRKESRLAKKAKKHEFFSNKKERGLSRKLKNDDSLQSRSEPFAKFSKNVSQKALKNKASLQQAFRKKDKSDTLMPSKAASLAKISKNASQKPEGKNKKNSIDVNNVSLQDEFRMELIEQEKVRKELDAQMRRERSKMLKEDNEADDREIRRMEKKLKLKKRSEKSINNFFAEDGLDYLLEVCDRSKIKDAVSVEQNFKDDDSDFGEDYIQVTGKPTKKKKRVEIKDESDSDEGPSELSSRRGSLKKDRQESLHKKQNMCQDNSNEDVSDEEDENAEFSDDDDDDDDDDDSFGSESENHSRDSDVADISDNSVSHLDSIGGKRKIQCKEMDEGAKKIKICEEVKIKAKEKKAQKKIDETTKSTSKKTRKVTGKQVDVPGDKLSNVENEVNLKHKKGKAAESNNKPVVTNKAGPSKDSLDDEIENPFSDDEVSSLGGDSNLEDVSEDESQTKKSDKEFWEDIYGRTRDKEGNVVSAYQPPQLRKNSGSVDSEKLARLKKQLKGLLNRLAENNMVSISSQIENLYMSHSRNEMNETLWALLKESLIAEVTTPERLVAEHAMLIAILGANIGSEVSAHCLQHCVTEWHQLWEQGPEVGDKRTNNVLLLVSYMYHFKLFHCTLLYDILEVLLAKIGEKEVELVLLVLRTVGFSLRKEDPARLKDFVLKVQLLANGQEAAAEGSRARFMLDTVLAIKNNNMTKIPNYDPEYGERIKKTLRACIRKGNYNAELKITLEDLLKADVRGRWWVVGSAWTGELPGEKDGKTTLREDKPKIIEQGFSSKLMELAKKQRMNTDTRRSVFCIIMSAEDYLDAFEKLLKLALKGPSEREIMNVLLHCLLHEKQYNLYYTYLARRFCQCDRKFQVMLQFAVWDKVQDMKALSPSSVTNLAKFLSFLILDKSLAISVLKVVHFAELDKPAVRFIRQVLLGILLADSEEAVVSAFGRIANSKPLKLFREGLRLFLHHFVLRNSKAIAGIDMTLLTIRVKLADSALSAAERGLSL